jgi:hypothetical protein
MAIMIPINHDLDVTFDRAVGSLQAASRKPMVPTASGRRGNEKHLSPKAVRDLWSTGFFRKAEFGFRKKPMPSVLFRMAGRNEAASWPAARAEPFPMSQHSVQPRAKEVGGGHRLDLHAEAAFIDAEHGIVG